MSVPLNRAKGKTEMNESERFEKLPYHEQVKHVESKSNVRDSQRHFERKAEDNGAKVAHVSGIKEAMEAKAYYESRGAHDVKIVGGTSKPCVIFRGRG